MDAHSNSNPGGDSDSHGDTECYSIAYGDPNPNCYRYPDSNGIRDASFTHPNGDRYSLSIIDPNGYAYSISYSDTLRLGQSESVPDGDPDANTVFDANSYPDAKSYGDSDPDSYGDSFPESYS